ncbi:MAG: hypothetical protein M3317_03925 [Actinomycetota bacterium]|nr:hypothetical protein [Actinomycetota bacterium]
MGETTSRTPELSLKDTFLRAVAGLPEEDVRAAVVAEALGYLQQGFDAHYARGERTDDDVLLGDNAYALAVETIARLDEPRFVAVASRMIRDGAGRIAAGEAVSLQLWTPHLAGLLDIISGEGEERSEARITEAAGELLSG